MNNEFVIRMEGITKEFGSLKANNNVNLNIRKGEVHAILGENGAGKSTLMNILSGIYTPDHGSIKVNEEEVAFHSPQDSIGAGIGMIYQHFKLISAMKAWQNIIAGPSGSLMLDKKSCKRKINEICEETGLSLNLDAYVSDMGVGQKQTLEMLKVLYRGAEILILDEPTTVLTPQETDRLFSIIRKMRDSGKTAIIITHKLYEVMEISDRVTIMRKGEVITTLNTKETTQKEIAEIMVGKSMIMEFPRLKIPRGDVVMKVKDLRLEDLVSMRKLNGVSFELHHGEILGVAGVSGSGQKQLCQALTGLQKIDSGSVSVDGDEIAGLTAYDIFNKGVAQLNFVPEDRLGMGLIASMSLVDNVMLRDYQNGDSIFIDSKRAYKRTEELVEALDVMHPGIDKPISVLSGGNLQKILIGREIMSEPNILIASYPVRGLDLGVTHKVVELLNEQKQRGAGVLLIAEDLDLMLEVCDRIMVMYCGKISGIVDPETITKNDLGVLMTSIDEECPNG